jgi:hypothetical protein
VVFRDAYKTMIYLQDVLDIKENILDVLQEYIYENSTIDSKKIYASLLEMLCGSDDFIPLDEGQLLDALEIGGEFLLLKLHYDDFDLEQKSQKIKYKISQSLSVVVSYEDDGNSYDKIEKFVKYIHSISDEKQHCIFGVKKVAKLSEFPIKILFSGIFPINQLEMGVGEEIYRLIHSDDDYFIPRFEKFRDDISIEIGMPILPVFPRLDRSLDDFDVLLWDPLDGRIISEFCVCKKLSKETLEIYLVKLFYIYKILAEEKK